MKVINAYDGAQVRPGERFAIPGAVDWKRIREPEPAVMNADGIWDLTPTIEGVGVRRPDEYCTLVRVEPGWLTAFAIVRDSLGVERRAPLQVRWTHPGFFLQHVAFIPT